MLNLVKKILIIKFNVVIIYKVLLDVHWWSWANDHLKATYVIWYVIYGYLWPETFWKSKGWHKCIQHFIQHLIFVLDEILDRIFNVGWNPIFSFAHFHSTCCIQHSKLQKSIYLIIQNSEHNHTDSVAWVDRFQKTPQRENKKMIEKEKRERILQQNHKRVKDRRLGWIYRKWMWWILSLYWLKCLI